MSQSIKYYLKKIRNIEPLSFKEEQELIKKYQKGDQRAYNKIIESNLRFVVKIAKSYEGKGLPLEDLISEGNYGLVKALQRYDITRQVKLISYAVWWIRQSILNSLYTHTKTVRLPLNKILNVNKISKVREQLIQDLMRAPTNEEISEELNDPSIIEDLQHLHFMISLDEPQTDNDKNLHSVIHRPDHDLEKILINFEEDLKDLIKTFPQREQDIILMYYGVGYVRSYTLQEIGVDLGLTRERIRQIKKHVIKKLQQKKESEKLKTYHAIQEKTN